MATPVVTNGKDTPATGKIIRQWLLTKNFKQHFIDAFKTGLAATLCLWFGHLLGLKHSYWAAISAIVVMAADTAVTITSSRDRLIGTALGAFLGWATFYVWHGHYIIYGVAIAICIFLCSALAFDKAGRLAGVALTIVLLLHMDETPLQAATSRFLEVSLGIIVAFAVTLLVFPAKRSKATV